VKIVHRAFSVVAVLAILCICVPLLIYATIPKGNTDRNHFDAIIVLGCPANPDGTPSVKQRERVDEGISEFRKHVAPRLIMTGGAAHNQFTEAEVMAHYAVENGVPAADVVAESRAQNTVQNAFYSIEIMKEHGWNSAEIVSSPSHLARASLIFERFPIQYHTHASQPLDRAAEADAYFREIRYTDYLRVFGFKPSPYLPAGN
jgi:uncharacterized SAM-binding protein YcdF (DUF218 family)